MAPIRWDNIDPKGVSQGFRDSLLATQMAGTDFNAAGDEMQQLLDQRRKIDTANWDNQAKLNTNADISAIQNISTLSGLQDQKADFDSGSVFARHQAQANPEAINTAIGQRETALAEQIQNPALTAANTALGDTNDPIVAAKALYDSRLAQGDTITGAQGAADAFTAKPGEFNEAQIADVNAKRINAELAKVQGTTAPGVSIADQKANLLQSLPPNVVAPVIAGLEKDKQAATAVDTEQKALAEYNTGKAVLENEAQALQMLEKTGDIDLVTRHANAIPDGETKIRVLAKLDQHRQRLANFTPIEKADLVATDSAAGSTFNAMMAEPNAVLQSTIAANKPNIVIGEDRYKALQQGGGPNGVLETLKNKTGADGFWGVKTWASAIANDEKFQQQLVPLHKSLRDSGFTEEEADKIILGTVEQSGGTTEAWSGAEGFNVGDFLTGVGVNTQRMVRFKQGDAAAKQQQQTIDHNSSVLAQRKMDIARAATKEMMNAKAQNRPYNAGYVKIDSSDQGMKKFPTGSSASSNINLDAFNNTVEKMKNAMSKVNDFDRKTAKPVPSAWDMFKQIRAK